MQPGRRGRQGNPGAGDSCEQVEQSDGGEPVYDPDRRDNFERLEQGGGRKAGNDQNTGGYCEQIEQDGGREPINDPDTKENCKPLDCDCEQEEQDDGENLSVRQTYGTNVSRYHMMMEPVNDPDTGGAWEFPGSQPRWNPPSLYRTSELAG